jgi:hypothetical protein
MDEAANLYWVTFAKGASPNAGGRPAWPECKGSCDVLLNFTNDGPQVVVDPWKTRLDLTAGVADGARP